MPKQILFTNIGQLTTCKFGSDVPKIGAELDDVGLVENAGLLIKDNLVEWVGESAEFAKEYPDLKPDETIDVGGKVVTPGLVDPHTHPVFAATREDEFYLRNAGKSYMEIAEAGGGIRNSVRKLRAASADDLFANGMKYLDRILAAGTTTAEAKSGYGLSTESEVKSLEVIQRLDAEHAIDLAPTFLGAHEFPDEYREDREAYIKLLIEEMIPEVAERNLAEFCDIFTEQGVYNIDQSRRVMSAAREHGFKLKFHADELQSVGGAELAAKLGAISADHLVHISDRGIEMMAAAGTIAVLLPATTFFLGHTEYAPAQKMIAYGVPVAIATDFNPGSSFTSSLPVTMTVAAIHLKMSAAQILNAVTWNSACALGRQDRIGSLEPGKQADLVIWEADNYRQIPYSFGQNLVSRVYKMGKRVV
jgi:imidazolonepropionase